MGYSSFDLCASAHYVQDREVANGNHVTHSRTDWKWQLPFREPYLCLVVRVRLAGTLWENGSDYVLKSYNYYYPLLRVAGLVGPSKLPSMWVLRIFMTSVESFLFFKWIFYFLWFIVLASLSVQVLWIYSNLGEKWIFNCFCAFFDSSGLSQAQDLPGDNAAKRGKFAAPYHNSLRKFVLNLTHFTLILYEKECTIFLRAARPVVWTLRSQVQVNPGDTKRSTGHTWSHAFREFSRIIGPIRWANLAGLSCNLFRAFSSLIYGPGQASSTGPKIMTPTWKSPILFAGDLISVDIFRQFNWCQRRG